LQHFWKHINVKQKVYGYIYRSNSYGNRQIYAAPASTYLGLSFEIHNFFQWKFFEYREKFEELLTKAYFQNFRIYWALGAKKHSVRFSTAYREVWVRRYSDLKWVVVYHPTASRIAVSEVAKRVAYA